MAVWVLDSAERVSQVSKNQKQFNATMGVPMSFTLLIGSSAFRPSFGAVEPPIEHCRRCERHPNPQKVGRSGLLGFSSVETKFHDILPWVLRRKPYILCPPKVRS